MCCCNDRVNPATDRKPASVGTDGIVVRVHDMTCDHCARTVASALRTAIPGSEVDVDAASKTATIRGSADVALIHRTITTAGYTPSVAG